MGMSMNEFCRVASRAAIATLLLYGVNVAAAPIELSGRGVYHFASASGCPAGGDAAANADCNRIAVDIPEAKAEVDTTSRQILFSSGPVGKDIVVGDVLLQGSGIATNGQRVPLSLHVLVRHKGEQWEMETYVHAPVEGNFSQVSMDAYEIVVRDGPHAHTIMAPADVGKLFADPSLRKRLARSVVSVRSSDSDDPATAGIAVGLGFGKVSKSLLRAGFKATGTSSPVGVDQAFRSGNWEIELDALSSHIPRWVVQRELFLFGLENQPVLRAVQDSGFKKHDVLAFGARDGKGYLRFNGRETPFDGAVGSGYAFMQESFMGLILAWQRDQSLPKS
jgi:hypothetical protein